MREISLSEQCNLSCKQTLRSLEDAESFKNVQVRTTQMLLEKVCARLGNDELST